MTEDAARQMIEGYAATVVERLKAALPKEVNLFFEASPGMRGSVVTVDDRQIVVDQLAYVELQFVNIESPERVRPKLIQAANTLAVAISHEARGKTVLATRHLAPVEIPEKLIANATDFGLRLVVTFNLNTLEHHDVLVECLYSVA